MMTNELTLEGLARSTGMSLRTLRFYMQEGLLQSPDSRGKNARYSQYHLERLELIQRLKNLRLPLNEIRHLIENMTPDEIVQVRQYQNILNTKLSRSRSESLPETPPSGEGSSALEYIRGLETGMNNIRSVAGVPTVNPPAPQQIFSTSSNINGLRLKVQQKIKKESWSRIVIGDGIELTVREPVGSVDQANIQKLVEYARNLFGVQSNRERK